MPAYKVSGMDATGLEVTKTIVAEDEGEAQAEMRQRGYFVTAISQVSSPLSVLSKPKLQWLNQRDWIYLTVIFALILLLILK